MLETLLLRAELILVVMGILGAIKSTYNGWVKRNILTPLGRIEEVDDRTQSIEAKQDKLAERQDVLTDAVAALGESHEEDEEFDVAEFRRRTGRTDGADEYLSDD